MASDTWLKLHTSILTSAKFSSLPSNDHRWAFIALLLLQKKGLSGCPERLTIGHVFLSARRWKTVKSDLIKAGLLDERGLVIGFDDTQLSASAWRMRRMRERNNERHSDAHNDGESVECRVQSVYKNPPNPPVGGVALEAKTAQTDSITEVVDHLAAVTGRPLKADRATDHIAARLKDGYTPADCCKVIDHLWLEWGEDAKMSKFVDKTTPFRKGNFVRYLDAADATPTAGRAFQFEEEPWK